MSNECNRLLKNFKGLAFGEINTMNVSISDYGIWGCIVMLVLFLKEWYMRPNLWPACESFFDL